MASSSSSSDTTQDKDRVRRQPIDDFVAAVGGLQDIKTFRTDPTVARMRANLVLREGEETVRAVEVIGIAEAVEARFRLAQTNHSAWARGAAFHAWFMGSSCWGPRVGEHEHELEGKLKDDSDYRTILLRHLDWVHIPLCPVTAYLQLILRNTPISDWAEAAATAQQDASPLAFAWVWARSIGFGGSQTADVVALITMSGNVYRLMLSAERRKRWVARGETFGHKLWDEGIWAALGVAVKGWLARRETTVEPRATVTDAEELQATVKDAVVRLGRYGEQYAQLLGHGEDEEEREAVVGRIRALAGFILGKAEPPIPERHLLALTDLAKFSGP
ncbi:hypothetical protein C8F01DRAFT_975626 [Mycena amicta]|nr:hypothetical protein C8F01DRAFT_975626 [Mycena amicta]